MADLEDPTLADPDAADNQKYHWDKDFQRHIVALIISDRQFMLQSVDLVKPSYLTDKAHSKVAAIAIDYFKKQRSLPKKDFIIQELKDALKGNKALPYYLGEVNVLYEYFQPGLEARNYLQDKIVYFAKIQTLKNTFAESLKLIDKSPEDEGTWATIYEKMRAAMTTTQNFEIGVDYFKSIKDRYEKKKEDVLNETDRFILGLEGVDKEVGGGGFSRGELFSVVAGSGVGKSVLLACIAATNLMRGKKGVYISLELSEDKIADRMDAILSGFPVQNLLGHKDQIFESIENLKGIQREGDIWPLVIKQFPAGTATVNTIRAYLSQLRFHGFEPDFVIVDYVGEMALHPGMKTYESRELIVRELRGMAMEEKVFAATAMQPNRDAKRDNAKGETGRIDDEHLADAFGQIRPLDCCFSLNQNDNEKLLGIGRGYVIKQRDGKSRYQIYLSFDKSNLKITEISRDEYKELLNSQKEYVSEETKMDMLHETNKKRKFGEDKEEDEIDKIMKEQVESKDP